jgi:hypothetical protein
MSEYVSLVALEVNGVTIDDFASVQEGKVEVGQQVKLMNTTGFCRKIARYTLEVDYVIPSDSTEFDFTTVQNGTLTIDYLNGTRKTYGGVFTMDIGEAKYDGEKETHRMIGLMAVTRTTETSVLAAAGYGAGGYGQ